MFKIDPMINMGEITPYDFIKRLTTSVNVTKIELNSYKDE